MATLAQLEEQKRELEDKLDAGDMAAEAALKRIDAFGELVEVHEAAFAELSVLFAQRQGVEVISHVVLSIRDLSQWILPIGECFVN